MSENRRFLLVRRPRGYPVEEDFSLIASDIPSPPKGGFVVRNHFASLDPAQRGWMDDEESYLPPIALDDPVRATTIGMVHASDHPSFPVGQWVMGLNALEDFSVVVPGGFTMPIDAAAVASPSHYLSALGAVGLTAYFGLVEAARPKAGETLLVSGAAGAVGSAVGQIGKILGCRVIGIAGGAEKCRRLLDDYGFDAAIDYKGKDHAALVEAIAQAAPEGADIVFENVGGHVLEAEVFNLARHARIILCGLISEYNAASREGLRNLWQILARCATIHGFLISDYVDRFPEGATQMAQWLADGRLRVDEDIQYGLENAYSAFMRLFTGENTGKLILRIV
ncbi:NADP-dependent oxidoreductase [Sphingobium subterraneum]|uniref:Enoyl reductase (ER) domain-containing protein n=1 Tax=Sphingobium subterraneum TaxID=627688 RepID=A0A841J648_9SPHN|nr:NADP-dependent oxidoreductase [Sphingobium subterraneum]MBB6124015.1 hypothetical protein [Sphingobium subterraneum]